MVRALVPLGVWLGVPAFVELEAGDHQAASNALGGFAVFLGAAGRLGNLFLRLSILADGWAIVSTKGLSVLVGWGVLTSNLEVMARKLAAR